MSINQFNDVIKNIAVNAMNAENPASLVFGSVESTAPLKIRINQKLLLTEEFLFLSDNVRNHTGRAMIDGSQKSITYLNQLQEGEQVLMIRLNGGQLYYVAERAVT